MADIIVKLPEGMTRAEAMKYLEHGREMAKHLKRARMRLESAWYGLHDSEDREACTLSIEDIKDLLAKLEGK
jgi:hypothetical protein